MDDRTLGRGERYEDGGPLFADTVYRRGKQMSSGGPPGSRTQPRAVMSRLLCH